MNIIWLVNRGNTEAAPQLHPHPAMRQLPRNDRSSPRSWSLSIPSNGPAQFPLPLPVCGQQQGRASTTEVVLCNYSPTLPCTHPWCQGLLPCLAIEYGRDAVSHASSFVVLFLPSSAQNRRALNPRVEQDLSSPMSSLLRAQLWLHSSPEADRLSWLLDLCAKRFAVPGETLPLS